MSNDGLAPATDAEHEARVLRARARRLAVAPVQEGQADALAVVLCRVGDEEYAVPLDRLGAIPRAHGLTPLPCTPPHVAGLLNVRGDLVTVLDLSVVLELRAASVVGTTSQVLLVEASRGRVGLLVDEVLGVKQLLLDRLAQPLSRHDFVAGVADARTALLTVDKLLGDERFVVDEEVT